jgi:hypothetical protein
MPGIQKERQKHRLNLSAKASPNLFHSFCLTSVGPTLGMPPRGIHAYVDFGPPFLEADLVYQLIDDVYPAAAGREKVLTHDGARDGCGIESGPRIANDNEHASLMIARDAALNLLRRVIRASVLDRVREGFVQHQLNLKLTAGCAAHFINNSHDSLNNRLDDAGMAGQRHFQFYQKLAAIEFAAC